MTPLLAFKLNKSFWLFVFLIFAGMADAGAGILEVTGNFSYSRSNYGDASFSWTRRLGVSLGYYLWSESELQFSVQDVLYRTQITGIEDTTFHDQIFSFEWVQAFTPRLSFIQPYVKVGLGQLNRTATGSYAGGGVPPSVYDSVTGVVGLGCRFFLSQVFSLRVEGSGYLLNGSISTIQDNFAFTSGLSLYF